MIYKVSKRMEIAAAHKLDLSYESKCNFLHGHNYIVTVHIISSDLNKDDMVADFAHIKREIHGKLDHGYINDLLVGRNPTAEFIGEWITDRVNEYLNSNNRVSQCYKVSVQESEGNIAETLSPITNKYILDELNSGKKYIED